jgi:hypothetical protein
MLRSSGGELIFPNEWRRGFERQVLPFRAVKLCWAFCMTGLVLASSIETLLTCSLATNASPLKRTLVLVRHPRNYWNHQQGALDEIAHSLFDRQARHGRQGTHAGGTEGTSAGGPLRWQTPGRQPIPRRDRRADLFGATCASRRRAAPPQPHQPRPRTLSRNHILLFFSCSKTGPNTVILSLERSLKDVQHRPDLRR